MKKYWNFESLLRKGHWPNSAVDFEDSFTKAIPEDVLEVVLGNGEEKLFFEFDHGNEVRLGPEDLQDFPAFEPVKVRLETIFNRRSSHDDLVPNKLIFESVYAGQRIHACVSLAGLRMQALMESQSKAFADDVNGHGVPTVPWPKTFEAARKLLRKQLVMSTVTLREFQEEQRIWQANHRLYEFESVVLSQDDICIVLCTEEGSPLFWAYPSWLVNRCYDEHEPVSKSA